VLACRSQERGDKLAAKLRADALAVGARAPRLEVLVLDVSSLASVRVFAEAWGTTRRPLHILINNAGIYSMGGVLGAVHTLHTPCHEGSAHGVTALTSGTLRYRRVMQS